MAKIIKASGYYIIFFLAVLIIYSILIFKSFASDDFSVIKRVVFDEHGILIKGFFRPLSDITLFFNYIIGGFDPVGYHIFNMIFHAATVYMVFNLSGNIPWIPRDKRVLFSWLSALFFLTYPFHNEAVVWIVGRASLMAAFFAVTALAIGLSDIKQSLKYIGVCVCYFIGLTSYESIFVMPAMLIIIIYDTKSPLKQCYPWVACLSITVILHFILRIAVSGALFGEYGAEGIFNYSFFFTRILKVSGRLFLPPTDNSNLFLFLFLCLASAIGLFSFFVWRRRKDDPARYNSFCRLSLLLFLSLLVPWLFGLSTRTSDGDRLFYFPSVFLAIFLADLVVNCSRKKYMIPFAAGILIYQTIFLGMNIFTWKRASDITYNFIKTIERETNTKSRVFVINIPQEYKGAYIFRHGFYDAFFLKGIDTSKMVAVNYVETDDMQKIAGAIKPEIIDSYVFIPPFTKIGPGRKIVFSHAGIQSVIYPNPTDKIFYWNKQDLVLFKN